MATDRAESSDPASTHYLSDTGHIAIEIFDVLSGQRAALEAASDPDAQRCIAQARIVAPLKSIWEPMLAMPWLPERADPDDPASIVAMLSLYPLDGDPEAGLRLLDRFTTAGSLAACRDAVIRTFDSLAPSAHGIALPPVRYSLALASPAPPGLVDRNRGYTGFGGSPGSIMMIAVPDAYNLPRLATMAAHEAHHQVRLTHEPWDPATITVGQYLVLEGLAEAFAAELLGEQTLGPWTTAVSPDELARHRPTLVAALDQTGDPRPYMFGDWAAATSGYEPRGLPDFIGYTAGYQLVRTALDELGITATEATYLPWREIAAASRWLHGADA